MKAAYFRWAAYALYAIIVTALLFGLFANWAYDDPFITFRYAENLALGNGFVFNLGERVLSTTTPLFTLVLAAARFVTSDLQRAANFISALSTALGGLCLFELACCWRRSEAGNVMSWVALLLYPTLPLLLNTFGSEVATYVTLCLATLLCYAKNRYTLCGLCAALATLARNDGVLVVVVIGVHLLFSLWKGRSRLNILRFWRSFMPVYAGIVGAWIAFAWVYFGWPLPVTLAAKRAQGGMAISSSFAIRFLSVAESYGQYTWYRIAVGLACIGLVYGLVSRTKPSRAALGLLLGWTALYFISYSALGVSGYFWYYAPLVPGFVVLVGLGAQTVVDGLRRLFPSVPHPFGRAATLAGVVALIAVPWANMPAAAKKLDARAPLYQAMGTWLRTNTPLDASVGMLEVGIMGYYAQRRIIDFAGLIQPEVTRQITHETHYEQMAQWATEHYRPNYIVLHEGFAPNLEQTYIAQHCQLAQHFAGADYGYGTNMNVFRCA